MTNTRGETNTKTDEDKKVENKRLAVISMQKMGTERETPDKGGIQKIKMEI